MATINKAGYEFYMSKLSLRTYEKILAKARWEQMSISAVVMNYHPKLWARIQAYKPKEQKPPELK